MQEKIKTMRLRAESLANYYGNIGFDRLQSEFQSFVNCFNEIEANIKKEEQNEQVQDNDSSVV